MDNSNNSNNNGTSSSKNNNSNISNGTISSHNGPNPSSLTNAANHQQQQNRLAVNSSAFPSAHQSQPQQQQQQPQQHVGSGAPSRMAAPTTSRPTNPPMNGTAANRAPSTSRPTAQIAKTGGIRLSTMAGPAFAGQVAAMQQQPPYRPTMPTASSPTRRAAPNAVPLQPRQQQQQQQQQMQQRATHMQAQQQQQPPQQQTHAHQQQQQQQQRTKHVQIQPAAPAAPIMNNANRSSSMNGTGASWAVPNPLMSSAPSQQRLMPTPVPHVARPIAPPPPAMNSSQLMHQQHQQRPSSSNAVRQPPQQQQQQQQQQRQPILIQPHQQRPANYQHVQQQQQQQHASPHRQQQPQHQQQQQQQPQPHQYRHTQQQQQPQQQRPPPTRVVHHQQQQPIPQQRQQQSRPQMQHRPPHQQPLAAQTYHPQHRGVLPNGVPAQSSNRMMAQPPVHQQHPPRHMAPVARAPMHSTQNPTRSGSATAPNPLPHPLVPVPHPPGTPASARTKPKVVLSAEAKQALAKAIWSAIRHPQGLIQEDLLQAALATGLPRHAIMNAARVARERESQKRKQQQELQAQAHKAAAAAANNRAKQAGPTTTIRTNTTANAAPNAVSSASAQPASMVSSIPNPAIKLRYAERDKWKRIHSGIFMLQKSRFLAINHTISGMSRSVHLQKIPEREDLKMASQPTSDILAEARRIQQKLRTQKMRSFQQAPQPESENTVATPDAPPVQLLDPEQYKRMKLEAKKASKALDRSARKTRQAAADRINKQHKELSKAIGSHQAEFFKFHKARKSETLRLVKSIRDSKTKEQRQKEKSAAQLEKARMAALKANDMNAYSQLLEETKNERLQFLMSKTEDYFSAISSKLSVVRSTGESAGDADKGGTPAGGGGAGSYYSSAHLTTEEVRQPGILVGGDLKEYQLSGLQWLVSLYNNRLNGILADEMGLGKTIQAISLIAYLMEIKQNLGPFLVIVPLSTLSNWTNEFQKWCPSAHTISYKGTPGQRKEMYKDQVRSGHFNVLLTTYEYIIKDKASLRKIEWQYAIVDEGHRMKNSQSKFAVTLSTQYTTKFRLLLTGTPLMNDLSELWSLLNFLLPAIFNSVETFDQWFNKPFAQFGPSSNNNNTNTDPDEEEELLSNEERMFIIHRLHELLRPFMLRRVKSEVLDQLPEKVEKILRCELSSWQKELYRQISSKAITETTPGQAQVSAMNRGLNNIVMQLRKVCNHPYLFSPQGYHIDEEIIRSSAKIALLDQMLPKLKAAGHRVLMFTQMTAVMTILEDYFTYRGYLSLRLDGSTPAEEREKRMYKFNAPDSPYFIFLLSTRAGGLGLNLTAANTVVIYDSDWNPMMDLQAQDRAHRIGQRSEVSVFRLVTHSPVEEKILSRANEKLNMSELVVEAGQFDKRSVENDNSLERKKMMEILLTDFESFNAGATATTQDKAAADSERASQNGGSDDEEEDNTDVQEKEDDLNDLLSNNEIDFEIYEEIDKQRAANPMIADASLFTNPDEVPDWIKYPSGKKDDTVEEAPSAADGSRKRKEVVYDDGLTEKQFLRIMEDQAKTEENKKAKQKASRQSAAVETEMEEIVADGNTSQLTDWTFRKLISCTKSVIALKDPATKRRLCDVFLDKPSPEQYPDYYELIEKPMAINDILRKCRSKLYGNMQEYRDDWKLMLLNAKTFNGEGSWVAQDGNALEKELERVLKKNGFNEESIPKPSPPKKKKLRIKLSLKKVKTEKPPIVEDAADEIDTGVSSMQSPSKPKGRPRKRRKAT